MDIAKFSTESSLGKQKAERERAAIIEGKKKEERQRRLEAIRLRGDLIKQQATALAEKEQIINKLSDNPAYAKEIASKYDSQIGDIQDQIIELSNELGEKVPGASLRKKREEEEALRKRKTADPQQKMIVPEKQPQAKPESKNLRTTTKFKTDADPETPEDQIIESTTEGLGRLASGTVSPDQYNVNAALKDLADYAKNFEQAYDGAYGMFAKIAKSFYGDFGDTVKDIRESSKYSAGPPPAKPNLMDMPEKPGLEEAIAQNALAVVMELGRSFAGGLKTSRTPGAEMLGTIADKQEKDEKLWYDTAIKVHAKNVEAMKNYNTAWKDYMKTYNDIEKNIMQDSIKLIGEKYKTSSDYFKTLGISVNNENLSALKMAKLILESKVEGTKSLEIKARAQNLLAGNFIKLATAAHKAREIKRKEREGWFKFYFDDPDEFVVYAENLGFPTHLQITAYDNFLKYADKNSLMRAGKIADDTIKFADKNFDNFIRRWLGGGMIDTNFKRRHDFINMISWFAANGYLPRSERFKELIDAGYNIDDIKLDISDLEFHTKPALANQLKERLVRSVSEAAIDPATRSARALRNMYAFSRLSRISDLDVEDAMKQSLDILKKSGHVYSEQDKNKAKSAYILPMLLVGSSARKDRIMRKDFRRQEIPEDFDSRSVQENKELMTKKRDMEKMQLEEQKQKELKLQDEQKQKEIEAEKKKREALQPELDALGSRWVQEIFDAENYRNELQTMPSDNEDAIENQKELIAETEAENLKTTQRLNKLRSELGMKPVSIEDLIKLRKDISKFGFSKVNEKRLARIMTTGKASKEEKSWVRELYDTQKVISNPVKFIFESVIRFWDDKDEE